MKRIETIDPFGSEGMEIDVSVDADRICDIQPRMGYVNIYGLFDPKIKDTLAGFSRQRRITSPRKRVGSTFQDISSDEAVRIIVERIRATSGRRNACFVSPTHTNEVMYGIQKWFRCGVKSNDIHSFRYLTTNDIFNVDKNDNLPMHELPATRLLIVVGSDLRNDHPCIADLVKFFRKENHIRTVFITDNEQLRYSDGVDSVITVNDYTMFFRAVNHLLISSGKASGIFVEGIAVGYDEYKNDLLQHRYDDLLQAAATTATTVQEFVDMFVGTERSGVILSEKHLHPTTFCEVRNMMLLTERQAKPGSGIMLLKPDCNSQGLFDMGINPSFGPGNRPFDDDFLQLLHNAWHCNDVATYSTNIIDGLRTAAYDNIFIFGTTPPPDKRFGSSIRQAKFVCVQSAFENELTATADLLLPMNLPFESTGSYTNSFKVIQNFPQVVACPFQWNDFDFVQALSQQFDIEALSSPTDAFLEFIQFFKGGCCSQNKVRHVFIPTGTK